MPFSVNVKSDLLQNYICRKIKETGHMFGTKVAVEKNIEELLYVQQFTFFFNFLSVMKYKM
jgi:hypothetical protein